MNVLKFGGTSMGSVQAIQATMNIIINKKEPLAVVVSAMSGTTDQLLLCGKYALTNQPEQAKNTLTKIQQRHIETVQQLLPNNVQSGLLSTVKKICNEIEDVCNGIALLQELTAQTNDRLLSFGEILSSTIICEALVKSGCTATLKDARTIIKTNSRFGNALVDFTQTNKNITAYFKDKTNGITILPGFIASNEQGTTTTLGRGGSDYTASIIGAALQSQYVEIWTDVSGMMTADPRLVSNAKVIETISYEEAMELCHFGAKVIYPPTIQPLQNKGILLKVKNTFAPADAGTNIISTLTNYTGGICGISAVNSIATLTLEGNEMVGVPGFCKRLFEALANQNLNVILITQASSEHSICVALSENDIDLAKQAVDKTFEYEIFSQKLNPVSIEKGLSIIAVVGDGMKSKPGSSGKMFDSLGSNGINIRAIAQGSSERNISAVIQSQNVKKALNVLHEEFFETTKKQINLFIVGLGNVGKLLMEQLRTQQGSLEEQLGLQVKVVALANSRTMCIDEEGIDLTHWQEKLSQGQPMHLDTFIENVINKNMRNAILVDITASMPLALQYPSLLKKNIAVVACNKNAASSTYEFYKTLKNLSRQHNVGFYYETNVGANLPVIGTLNDLIRSGDQVTKIAAVLSGTLNYVFNEYNGTTPFAEVVKQAQQKGFTEPDPRLDLSGADVIRKILILARETGQAMQLDEVVCTPFLPESCMQGGVEQFYEQLLVHEPVFQALYHAAASEQKKLKFVATYANGKASVGLEHIPSHHDFYHLYGQDNIVQFYTHRYVEQPLVIKGAGAGAAVTASGIFADIIRATRK